MSDLWPEQVLLYAGLIVAVILHEVSHGVVALWFGDDTARRAGRITLNPIPHVDPMGSIILPGMAVLAGLPVLGWAKPVPVNPARLRHPRRQMLWVGLAGPFTNFSLMVAAALVARSMIDLDSMTGVHVVGNYGLEMDLLPLAFWSFALVNLFLGIFNMLPIPPLDGSSLIERALPARHLQTWYKFRPYGFLLLFAGLFMFDIFGRLIAPFADRLADFVLF